MSVPASRISRPVAGTPWNSPVCVPRAVQRVTTMSPSAIWSSMVKWRSGNACAQRGDVLLGPLAPADVLGRGVDDQVAGRHFVDDAEITPVVDLLDDAPDLRLVLL